MLKKTIRTLTGVVAVVVTLSVTLSGCAFGTNGLERRDHSGPREPGNAEPAGSERTYSGVPQGLLDNMEFLAIENPRGDLPIDVQLFAVKGARSLNQRVEDMTLDALKRGGAFHGRKAFTPIPTPVKQRAQPDAFIDAPGEVVADPAATSAPGLGDAAGGGPAAGGGSAGKAVVQVSDDVVFAGGKYVVTRVRARVKDSKTTRLFVTDLEADTTADGRDLFAGAVTPSDEDLADLSYGVDALPTFKNVERSWDELSDLGKDVTDNADRDVVLKAAGAGGVAGAGGRAPGERGAAGGHGAAGKAHAGGRGAAGKARAGGHGAAGKARAGGRGAAGGHGAAGADDARGFSCALKPCVALTFDDGPANSKLTNQLLATLDKHGATATFFLIGSNVDTYPEEAKRLYDAGHEVGSHSYSHADLKKLTPQRAGKEMADADAAIEAAGVPKPTLLRPPYGESSRAVDGQAAKRGERVVRWDVDTQDWLTKSKDKTVQNAVDQMRPGSIILLHSIYEPTIQATDDILTQLNEQGYFAVSVSELFANIKFSAGREYFCRGYRLAVCSNPEHPAVARNH